MSYPPRLYPDAAAWSAAPQKRILLFGMSGLGKTHVSRMLRANGAWFHYSIDYRIGTRYMGELISDDFKRHAMKVPHLRAIRLQNPAVLTEVHYSRNALALALENHPAIRAIDVKKKVSEKAITIAKQQYKPQWGVNASYAYRDDMPSGDSRSDLFSVGVTFDLPLFTEDRQDKQVAASIAESEAIRTEKLLLIKQMISAIEKELRQLKRLSERQSIYKDQLLKQTNEQAESSLTAYTNDDGDFSEVVRARIAGLNARISALKIDVDALKTVARINYFFAQSNTKPVLAHTSKFGEK